MLMKCSFKDVFIHQKLILKRGRIPYAKEGENFIILWIDWILFKLMKLNNKGDVGGTSNKRYTLHKFERI